jgi:AcrR family transcriptional regulator
MGFRLSSVRSTLAPMSATEPRPLRADARRNRERVVAAARSVFAECGQQAQMDDVAREAGVGVGTVYRHFATKDALIGELMRIKFDHHAEVARRWAQRAEGWAAFEGFLRETFGEMAKDATMQRMMWVVNDAALDYAEDARLVLAEVVDGLIASAHAEGTLRPDFVGSDMPALMCSVGGVMSAQHKRMPPWQRIADVVIDGLRAR